MITAEHSAGTRFVLMALPVVGSIYALRHTAPRLMEIQALRVIAPPVILIVAVLGSIIGGITNPTPAALGATGAIMLAAARKLRGNQRSGRILVGIDLHCNHVADEGKF